MVSISVDVKGAPSVTDVRLGMYSSDSRHRVHITAILKTLISLKNLIHVYGKYDNSLNYFVGIWCMCIGLQCYKLRSEQVHYGYMRKKVA